MYILTYILQSSVLGRQILAPPPIPLSRQQRASWIRRFKNGEWWLSEEEHAFHVHMQERMRHFGGQGFQNTWPGVWRNQHIRVIMSYDYGM